MLYDTINPEAIKLILKDLKPAQRILDVGCGTGKLGRFLKSRSDCHVTGIEIDKDSAKIAKGAYDRLIIMNLEDLINGRCRFQEDGKYDFIVLGDILEHVTDPVALLRCLDDLLEKDGFLIASIPNIANWQIRLRLLFGNFDYSGGILDQGHLRFFTYETARRLLENSGYRIIKVINNNETWLIRFLGRLWKRMFAFQFVFKCIKAGR